VFLQCFDTVGWVIWPVKTHPRYDLYVFGGTLNLNQSINQSLFCTVFPRYHAFLPLCQATTWQHRVDYLFLWSTLSSSAHRYCVDLRTWLWLMAVILRYSTEFGKPGLQTTMCGGIYARVYCILVLVQCRPKESSRSLSHLLMSSLSF